MQVRRITLVVCLVVGMAAGAMGTATHRAHRAGKTEDDILATNVNTFGITSNSKVGMPPG